MNLFSRLRYFLTSCFCTSLIAASLFTFYSPLLLAQTNSDGVKNALLRPQLNGLSTYNNMGKNYYLVGFYTSESCTQAQTCLDQQSAMRFLLKVVTPRWTASNYSLMWQTDLAMNNQEVLKGEDIRALIDFTQLAETPLSAGDQIDVSYESQYTTIAVNKVIAIRTKNKTLFNYISRVWLGSTPPTKQFQADLLVGHGGQIDARLRSEFEQIKPSAKRLSLLDNWDISKKRLIAQQHESEAEAQKIAMAKEKLLAETQAQEKAQALLQAQAAAQEQAALKEQTVAAAAVLSKTKNTATKNTTTKNTTTKTTAAKIKKLTKADKKSAIAAASNEISNAIDREIVYPEWAKQLQHQGKITVIIKLNQLAELISIEDIQPVHAGLLGKAVINAIKKALPTPIQHAEHLPEQWQMLYQYQFTLGNMPAVQHSAANSSAAINTKNATANTQTAISNTQTATTNTQTSIAADANSGSAVADIQANIEYPYWARNLNQGGNVTIQFFIDKQGYITNQKLINSSKHPGLNDAVINGAKKTEPFNSQRIEAENGKLEFIISHDFRP